MSGWFTPGHCQDIDGFLAHDPGTCPGAILNCNGKCCGPPRAREDRRKAREDAAIYAQADENCHRPREATCTCGDIKPYGTGPHVCVGNEPEDARDAVPSEGEDGR